VPTVIRGILKMLGKVGGVDHELLGNAATDNASTTHAAVLTNANTSTMVCSDARGSNAPRTGTKDEEIKVKF
jgi:hypothetical protein